MTDLSRLLPVSEFPNASTWLQAVARARKALEGNPGLDWLDEEEVIEKRAALREEHSDFLDHILFVAEDRRGALRGVWLRGKLEGMWCACDAEEVDLSPLWRSTDDFVECALNREGRPGLPDLEGRASDAERARFGDIIKAYRANLEGGEVDPDDVLTMFFAFTVIALTPENDLGALIPFLQFENQWVQERAAVTLGAFRYAPATEALRALAQTSGNGALAARGVLKTLSA
jgi:hypothetical protein